MIKLKEVEAPKPEEGLIPVMLRDETMQNRKARLLENMQKDGFDAVVVYADLEHGSNFEYLCGFLPRFEEALLILHANGKAFMVLGNENLNKAGKARIEAVPIHMPHFSLPNQPMQTEKSVAQILASCELEDAGILPAMRRIIICCLICRIFLLRHSRRFAEKHSLPMQRISSLEKTVFGQPTMRMSLHTMNTGQHWQETAY